jgi:hypothetical protein
MDETSAMTEPPRRSRMPYLLAGVGAGGGILYPTSHHFSMTGEYWTLGVPFPAIRIKHGVIDVSLQPGWRFTANYPGMLLDAALAFAFLCGVIWLWQRWARQRGVG